MQDPSAVHHSPRKSDFRPTASWENLRLRAELLRRLRDFFAERGFLEVETPILSADTVVDRHLDPFCTDVAGPPGESPRRLWLQTSPEFAMKRLLAAGGEAIYQVARVFRLGEQGPLHNGEFTMVEWYRTGDTMDEGIQLTSDLCQAMLRRGPAERLTYAEAFQQHVGLDPHTCDTEALVSAVAALGIAPPASLAADDRDGWLDLLLVERVQPNLGVTRPLLLYDYPASQAALARIRPQDPPVAERFELYVSGIELANGYHELLDPAELRVRNHRANAQRHADGKQTLPEESRLLAAMQAGLPPAVGVSLGFDRLVMLAAGAKNLDEVIAFPFHRA
ncbi:MAG: EF-P lysine aminoacylase GenX [Planctomycetes bacterium RBG_13_63_9]|nr:MAG: EF-P lysine aminoacylase GenX [Planctomycetes bacterium RBG_13_63_9]